MSWQGVGVVVGDDVVTDDGADVAPGSSQPPTICAELVGRIAALDAAAPRADGAPAQVGRPSRTRDPFPAEPRLDVPGLGQRMIGSTALVIGRAGGSAGVDIAVADPRVSRRHAEVWADGEVVLCRDLGSRNGTVRLREGVRHRVGDASVGASVLVTGDDVVTADDVLLLRVLDPPSGDDPFRLDPSGDDPFRLDPSGVDPSRIDQRAAAADHDSR